MRARIGRTVTVPLTRVGASGSIPAEVGVASPIFTSHGPRPLEHPQVMSTAVEVEFFPMEPANDASLALGCLPDRLLEGSER